MKKSVTVLIILIIIIAAYFILKPKTENQTTGQENILADIPVSVTSVKKEKLSNVISLVGVINASNDVNVISETQGLVTATRVKVGDYVKEGAILVEIDDVLKQSNMASAEINYLKSKRDYERSETLYQENSISAAQLDLARLQMKAAETQLTVAKKQLDDTKIKSPISGTVNIRMVDKGTMVQPGSPIANIVDISNLKVKLNISEREAFLIKPGDPVEVTTDVFPEAKFNGRVDNVASKADESHTYAVEIRMANSSKYPLKAGMFSRVNFVSIRALDALSIPREALVGSIRDARVFVISNNIAKMKTITVGRQSGNFIEVLNGVSENEMVVTNGQNNLSENAKVSIVK
jgi:RND family efflux transporter MFP subunit